MLRAGVLPGRHRHVRAHRGHVSGGGVPRRIRQSPVRSRNGKALRAVIKALASSGLLAEDVKKDLGAIREARDGAAYRETGTATEDESKRTIELTEDVLKRLADARVSRSESLRR